MEDKVMIEDDKSFHQQSRREINRAKQDFQHAIGYSKPNDECQLWVECQGHWDNNIEVAEWAIAEWPKKGKGVC